MRICSGGCTSTSTAQHRMQSVQGSVDGYEGTAIDALSWRPFRVHGCGGRLGPVAYRRSLRVPTVSGSRSRDDEGTLNG